MEENLEKYKYSAPENVALDYTPEELKISADTVDNREEVIEKGEDKFADSGRPNLDLMPDEQKKLYKEKEKRDLEAIDKALSDGVIDKVTHDALYKSYENSWEKHQEMVEQIVRMMGGAPKAVKYKNLYNGKTDEETPYFIEHVRPDTSMVLEYEVNAPWRPENELPDSKGEKTTISFVISPLKNVERAIEKVKIGGQYDTERKKELAKLKPGQTPEEAGLSKSKLRLPHERLKDVYRLTILAPFYDDLQAFCNMMVENNWATKSSRPSKYLDNDVSNAEEFYRNSKNYRDIKLHMPFGNESAEIQGKLEGQFDADTLTHYIYAKTRGLPSKFKTAVTEGYKRLINRKMLNGMRTIQNINTKAYSDYNDKVLSRVKKSEDRARACGVKPDNNGTYAVARKIIKEAFLVRSAVALMPDSFAKSAAWVRDVVKRYWSVIADKYLVKLGPKDLYRPWCHQKEKGR